MIQVEIGKLSVTPEMLGQAENDPRLSGVVLSKPGQQVSISVDDTLVGFMTSRQDKSFWRTGAIYISPNHRGHGYAALAIEQFFADKNKGIALIETDNYQSQATFKKCGFTKHGMVVDSGISYDVWTLVKF